MIIDDKIMVVEIQFRHGPETARERGGADQKYSGRIEK